MNKEEIVAKLKEARGLISDEKNWTKRHFFLEKTDCEKCYCAHGACYAATGITSYDDYYADPTPTVDRAAHEIRSFLWKVGLTYSFNDSSTHGEVLAKFDEAIAMAEKA